MSSSILCDIFQKLINYEIQCLKKYDLKLNCLHILKSNLCKYLESDLNLILSNLAWTLAVLALQSQFLMHFDDCINAKWLKFDTVCVAE